MKKVQTNIENIQEKLNLFKQKLEQIPNDNSNENIELKQAVKRQIERLEKQIHQNADN